MVTLVSDSPYDILTEIAIGDCVVMLGSKRMVLHYVNLKTAKSVKISLLDKVSICTIFFRKNKIKITDYFLYGHGLTKRGIF